MPTARGRCGALSEKDAAERTGEKAEAASQKYWIHSHGSVSVCSRRGSGKLFIGNGKERIRTFVDAREHSGASESTQRRVSSDKERTGRRAYSGRLFRETQHRSLPDAPALSRYTQQTLQNDG